MLNDERQNALPLKLGIRQRCSLSLLLCSIMLEILDTAVRHKTAIKKHTDQKT